MYINTAEIISGVPSSWPGYDLGIGASGEKVRQLQTQLNRIARHHPAILHGLSAQLSGYLRCTAGKVQGILFVTNRALRRTGPLRFPVMIPPEREKNRKPRPSM